MTTIATDGKTIAADGQGTANYGVIARTTCKKIIARNGHIFAVAGANALTQVLASWYESGADPEKTPKYTHDSGWSLLVISRKGGFVYSSECPYPSEVEYPVAIGSGSEMALGAMLAGATPRDAVEIVASQTNHTGGDILALSIADALRAAAVPVYEAAE